MVVPTWINCHTSEYCQNKQSLVSKEFSKAILLNLMISMEKKKISNRAMLLFPKQLIPKLKWVSDLLVLNCLGSRLNVADKVGGTVLL